MIDIKRLILLIALTFPVVTYSQNDNKAIKDAIQENKIDNIRIISDSVFYPGQFLKFDFEIKTESGVTARASEKKSLWKDAAIFITGGSEVEPGRIQTHEAFKFYPRKPLIITIELANETDSLKIFPSYCFDNFVLLKAGLDGKPGSDGSSGTDAFSANRAFSGGSGSPGGYGLNGPVLGVEVGEELIEGKPHIILNVDGQKWPVQPGCGAIKIHSKGGNGGAGGRGGSGGNAYRYQGRFRGNGGYGGHGGGGGPGGNGGDIIFSGSAYEKYESNIEAVSIVGLGGRGGKGGYGGSGFYQGMSGDDGGRGADGQPGRIIRPNDVVAKAKPTPTSIVLTTDIEGRLFIDNKEVGALTPGKPTKLLVSAGKVLVELRLGDKTLFSEMLNVMTNQQVKKHITKPEDPTTAK